MQECENCPDLCISPYRAVHPKCFKPGCRKQKIFELRIVNLVNAQREKAGLPKLVIDPRLTRAARAKAKEMAEDGYFRHISPKYGSPFEMLKSFGINFRWAGENIASGYFSPDMVFKGWLASPGHRNNILKPEYSHIGVGYYYNEKGNFNHFWVQEFICPP